ncbi:GMC oxidoreductase-domain-containing protein [Mycena pura]|uniref:GMC oxidoreductase-domain-containing protein n=1 Tax=Mycena pura TaxID=153505 RepID=A0AAD7E406_9AGAR|nr:GMC oxidoreductase-domain-containing protein [Mycena pura]
MHYLVALEIAFIVEMVAEDALAILNLAEDVFIAGDVNDVAKDMFGPSVDLAALMGPGKKDRPSLYHLRNRSVGHVASQWSDLMILKNNLRTRRMCIPTISASHISMAKPAAHDIVFAGGGTAACVVAGRLAAADPNLKILLIEAGQHINNIKAHIQPARYFTNLASGGDMFTFHATKPSKALGNRSCIIPAGKAVGGGSAVNFKGLNKGAAGS